LLRAGVPFEPFLLQALSSDDPCEIARFMERLKPDAIATTREMLLDCRLVVRDSCGARASGDRSMFPISDGLTAVFG
jgi:hypothetical protein